jgi:hypothetical protein
MTRNNLQTTEFDSFVLRIRLDDALACSQPGQDASVDVEWLAYQDYIAEQLDAINPDAITSELMETGGWISDEGEDLLSDEYENRKRILWIACVNIREETKDIYDDTEEHR